MRVWKPFSQHPLVLSLNQEEFWPSRSSCLEDNAQRRSPRGLQPSAELTVAASLPTSLSRPTLVTYLPGVSSPNLPGQVALIQPKFVSVSVLQRNKPRRHVCIYIYTDRVRFAFKELTHAVMGTGKSSICRAGQQTKDLGKSWCCRFQRRDSLKTEILLPPGSSVFFLTPLRPYADTWAQTVYASSQSSVGTRHTGAARERLTTIKLHGIGHVALLSHHIL